MEAFERHLREAISLNRERAPRYAAASSGASRPISRSLIAAELLLLPLARWFDRRAARYRRAGLPLLDALFLPMSGAPDYGAAFVDGPPLRSGAVAGLRARIRGGFAAGSFAGASRVLGLELDALRTRGGNHLVRHLLESAHRLAMLAPALERQSAAAGVPSPSRMFASLLRLHLYGLGSAARLDRRAWSLQSRGIGIIANDLPPIPVPGTEWR